MDNSESIALLVNQQVNLNIEPAVTPQQLVEYSDVIRELAAQKKDDTAEAEPQAEQNGHRESFKI